MIKHKIEILNSNEGLSDSDKEMDKRATAAIKSAIFKAKTCGRPIAKYDAKNKKAFLEYPDGRVEYAE